MQPLLDVWIMTSMTKAPDKYQIEATKRFALLLKGIESFIQKHPTLTYIEFDYYIVHDVTLFSVEPEFDFNALKHTIDSIRKTLPAVKRIFTKPIIVLKDTDDGFGENARIINQNTLLHLANHSQHVANLTARGVKPRKLLTRIYEDDYAIYENIVFCNYIDEIMHLVNKNRRILNNLLYASDILRFNLLEKVNHLNYFLALGKLHTGYIRDFSQYFTVSKQLLNDLTTIQKTSQPRLSKAIYKKNSQRNKNLSLKKTNIFLSQKDYRQVYKTYKYLLGNAMIPTSEVLDIDMEWLRKTYMSYIQMLTLFSASHFNFEMDSKAKIDLNDLSVNLTFRDWKLTIQNLEGEAMLLYFKKDTYYRMMIVGQDYDESKIKEHKSKRRLHEVIKVNPYDEDYLNRKDVYVSMDDIDSFRRLQQIILKGMSYSDTLRTVCPFCGGHVVPIDGGHQCEDCMLMIKDQVCTETKQNFLYTDIPVHKRYIIDPKHKQLEDYWYYEKQVESMMYFKNITKINQDSEIICPHCHQIHPKKMGLKDTLK